MLGSGKNRVSLWLIMLSFNLYAGQLKISTYNLLNFSNTTGNERIKYFRQVIDYLKPDILVVQEMANETGMEVFRDSVLNYVDTDFSSAPFHDGPDTDNSLFYRRAKVEFIDALYIPTVNRDIARYRMRMKDSNRDFFIFSVHFKAGEEFEFMRLQEAMRLRSHLDSLPDSTEYLVAGDFNFYYNEAGYCKLVDSIEISPRGLRDILNLEGKWHDNYHYAYAHTQSTRIEQLPDGGAGGGLDDRFDLILCSPNFLDTAGLFLPRESYTILGNDGEHFNKSINSGINYAVPAEVARALYYASDHLPVSVIIMDGLGVDSKGKEVVIYPNPMRTQAYIKLPHFDDFKKARVTITNILGQRMYEVESINPNLVAISHDKFNVGIYFVHIQIETKYNNHNFQTKLAVMR
ncbi:MAG: endonuclease/exonuclease/phosphatase family protein [candidate division WOR-3 bacterium]|nr:endonuclease/exonuclease/phosphatase family protein [candidate division WOR-3 bacterium]